MRARLTLGDLGGSVGNQGVFSTSYPIRIPAGPGGVTPSIALSYNSNGGKGVAGEGWGISSVECVVRRGQTAEGVHRWGSPNFGWPSYVAPDDFFLNGNRLHACVANEGSCDGFGSYRTERDTFAKITMPTADTWKVTSLDGTVKTFGGPNATWTSLNGEYMWCISSTQELGMGEAGRIDYEYLRTPWARRWSPSP